MALQFTDQTAREAIDSGKIVVIDFWATWCGPCLKMSPLIDQLAEEFEGQIEIGKYNCEDENDFAVKNQIRALPTVIFFKDGEAKIRLAGSQTYDRLVENANLLLQS